MARYQAPKPDMTNWEWLTYIGWRCLFPPVLLWDLNKVIMHRLLGEKIGRKVLLAQTMDFSSFNSVDTDFYSRTREVKCESHTVVTHDGCELDTMEIKHVSQQESEPDQQIYIINMTGNASCYEGTIPELLSDAYELRCNVVGFNFRGVSKSKGVATSANDLVTDGIAEVQRLLDDGVNPEHIILKGHSLGAAVATLVAKYFHDHGQKINLFNGRSFSSVTNEIVGHLRTIGKDETKHEEEGRNGIILGNISWPIVKYILVSSGWEINAADAYKALPDTHKEYMLVRSSRENRYKDPEIQDDHVIPHYASLHMALREEHHKHKKNHNKAQLEIAKSRKMELVNYRKHDVGHNVSLNDLRTRHGYSTGSEFFKKFVKRTIEHHDEVSHTQQAAIR